jgi:hypothetical protein
VLALVPWLQEAPQAIVKPRRTHFVTRRVRGALLFHLSIIGIAGDIFEADV